MADLIWHMVNNMGLTLQLLPFVCEQWTFLLAINTYVQFETEQAKYIGGAQQQPAGNGNPDTTTDAAMVLNSSSVNTPLGPVSSASSLLVGGLWQARLGASILAAIAMLLLIQ